MDRTQRNCASDPINQSLVWLPCPFGSFVVICVLYIFSTLRKCLCRDQYIHSEVHTLESHCADCKIISMLGKKNVCHSSQSESDGEKVGRGRTNLVCWGREAAILTLQKPGPDANICTQIYHFCAVCTCSQQT